MTLNSPRRFKRRTRPSRAPETSAALMPGLFRWLKLEEGAREFAAQRAFDVAAGPRVAARARAERLRGNTLYVRVASASWSHELHALKGELLQKLKLTRGGEGIDELRFTVGSLDELPSWDTAVAPEPSRVRQESLDDRSAAPSPEVQAALSDVADAELRVALKGLFVRLRPLR